MWYSLNHMFKTQSFNHQPATKHSANDEVLRAHARTSRSSPRTDCPLLRATKFDEPWDVQGLKLTFKASQQLYEGHQLFF